MPAIFLGSMSTVVDTSEMQRRAFNQAFEEFGLDWRWSQDEYREMLKKSGGHQRIVEYASDRGDDVDPQALHEKKSELFRQNLAAGPVTVRPGVLDTVTKARESGWRVGLVTTTFADNVAALLDAVSPDLRRADFDLVVDDSSTDGRKPDPAPYTLALDTLGEAARDCVAVEDNTAGVRAAVAAGLACVAFPNQNTAAHDFPDAARRVEQLDFAQLRQLRDGH